MDTVTLEVEVVGVIVGVATLVSALVAFLGKRVFTALDRHAKQIGDLDRKVARMGKGDDGK